MLANRIIHVQVLDEIIDTNQYAFLRGRAIGEAIRNVLFFHFLCTEQKTGFIASVDFKKAFDSLDHGYMTQCLLSFGYGASFIKWVKALYENVEGCVLNNGKSTGYFLITRGVRQGDPPLSLYVYNLFKNTCITYQTFSRYKRSSRRYE